MARMRVFVVLALALTAGGVLAFGTYNYIQKTPAQASSSIPTTAVVVAAADLDIGAELTRDDVRSSSGRRRGAAGHDKDANEAVGRGVILPMIAERTDPADEAGVEGCRRRAAAGDSAGAARGVGARQRSDRRGRLRRARHPRRRRRDAEPDEQARRTPPPR